MFPPVTAKHLPVTQPAAGRLSRGGQAVPYPAGFSTALFSRLIFTRPLKSGGRGELPAGSGAPRCRPHPGEPAVMGWKGGQSQSSPVMRALRSSLATAEPAGGAPRVWLSLSLKETTLPETPRGWRGRQDQDQARESLSRPASHRWLLQQRCSLPCPCPGAIRATLRDTMSPSSEGGQQDQPPQPAWRLGAT